MTRSRIVTSLAFILASALVACGSDLVVDPDAGFPPDAAAFNPGNGGPGGGYGEGGGAGPAVDASFTPVCPDADKQCPETFTYPFNSEMSVELRGDYRPDAWDDGDPMMHVGNVWTVTVSVPFDQPVEYKFLVNGTQWVTDPNNPSTVTDPQGNANSVDAALTCANPTCAEPPVPPPGVFDWRDATIYYVFVDRFFNGNPANDCPNIATVDAPAQYMGGDWAGVTKKIQSGYFTDLGVNTLWITFPVTNADTYAGAGVAGDTHVYSAYHGYWPSDVTTVERCFGTPQDLTAMVAAAHTAKLKILFDYVMVDTYIGSAVYTQNPSWFWPNTSPNGDCVCGQGCDFDADGLKCWFAPYLPHFNYTVQAARDYSVNAALNVAQTYGADGFRLDAIKQVDLSWLEEMRSTVQAKIVASESPPQRFYMVGETYDFSNRPLIASFIDPDTMLDGQEDFPLRYQLTTAVLLRQQGMDALAAFMDSNDEFYGVDAVMMSFLGNQDLPRTIGLAEDTPVFPNPYDDGKSLAWSGQPTLPTTISAFQRLATAFAVLMTNKGAPMIYYGDEIGLPGAGDPDNRRLMPWSGLTANQEYLYGAVKSLLAIRAAHPALRRGHRMTLSVTADVWVYSMTTEAGDPTPETVYVAINRSDSDQPIAVLPSQPLQELVTAMPVTGPTATVPARQARIFVAQP